MTKFRVGDKVVCNRPVPTMMNKKGVSGTVTEVVEYGRLIRLSHPFDVNGFYTPNQFDLFRKMKMVNK